MILEGGWEVAGIRQDESRYKKAGGQEDIHLSFFVSYPEMFCTVCDATNSDVTIR